MAEMFGMFALRAQRVGEASPSLSSTPRTRKAKMPKMQARRWCVICDLLKAPERTSRRLIVRLSRWQPVNVRRIECADDVKRRRGGGR